MYVSSLVSRQDVGRRRQPQGIIFNTIYFPSVGAAYINGRPKNELAHILLIGGTHNKQGSKNHLSTLV